MSKIIFIIFTFKKFYFSGKSKANLLMKRLARTARLEPAQAIPAWLCAFKKAGSGILRDIRPYSIDTIWRMARVTGLEPATSAVTGRRSNQLSYTRLPK